MADSQNLETIEISIDVTEFATITNCIADTEDFCIITGYENRFFAVRGCLFGDKLIVSKEELVLTLDLLALFNDFYHWFGVDNVFVTRTMDLYQKLGAKLLDFSEEVEETELASILEDNNIVLDEWKNIGPILTATATILNGKIFLRLKMNSNDVILSPANQEDLDEFIRQIYYANEELGYI